MERGFKSLVSINLPLTPWVAFFTVLYKIRHPRWKLEVHKKDETIFEVFEKDEIFNY